MGKKTTIRRMLRKIQTFFVFDLAFRKGAIRDGVSSPSGRSLNDTSDACKLSPA